MAHGAHSSEHRSVGMSGTCRVFGTGRKNEQKKKKKILPKKTGTFYQLKVILSKSNYL